MQLKSISHCGAEMDAATNATDQALKVIPYTAALKCIVS